jgi:hypothetical protein
MLLFLPRLCCTVLLVWIALLLLPLLLTLQLLPFLQYWCQQLAKCLAAACNALPLLPRQAQLLQRLQACIRRMSTITRCSCMIFNDKVQALCHVTSRLHICR